ncbi:MAG: PorT family protein [Flavobacteriales bacterium]|nr:PorT family protein [Flavobacteriales bacterium]
MKLIITFGLSIVISMGIAQNFSVGGEIGFITSKNDDYKLSTIENRRNTYYIGVNGNYKLSDRFELGTGLSYLRQGIKHETCYIFDEGVKNELIRKIDYIMLPTLVNFFIDKNKKLYGTLGIYNGLNINAVQEFPDPIGGCEIYYAKDLTNRSKHLIGGTVGMGYRIHHRDRINTNINIKYHQGFNNIITQRRDLYPFNVGFEQYGSLVISISSNFSL